LFIASAEPRTRLSLLQRSLIQGDEAPLGSRLSDERINEVFAEEGISFREDEGSVYAPAVTLWGLLREHSESIMPAEAGSRNRSTPSAGTRSNAS
jgi:hypothetical protein